ncbi:FAD:protein FMN transferase [Coralloluteibacterium thermophilus]|uniref:FAD:protein FMN transferase n=1 Tax=Coralloluteibacterium thermophilum TaxID=2707049 RepID=A0ABV9NNV0_9GAMM
MRPLHALRAWLFAALALAASVAGAGERVRAFAGESMGTTWSVQVVAPADVDDDTLRGAVEAEFAAIVAQMSAWEPDSDLARFNAAPAGSRHALPAPLSDVLAYALALAEATGGAFDPTVGALTEAWGFGTGAPRTAPPSAEALAGARARVGWQRLDFDPATGGATQPGGLLLDVNALVPGFAADRAGARLAALGATASLVEIGGEFRARGSKPDGSPWRIAVELPPDAHGVEGRRAAVVALRDAAAGSSGDYRAYFEHAGRRYGHTLDPRTGEPVAHGLAAVTVLDAEAMHADAQAAAIMVLGPRAGWRWARRQGLAALLVERRGDGFRVRTTPQFRRALAR